MIAPIPKIGAGDLPRIPIVPLLKSSVIERLTRAPRLPCTVVCKPPHGPPPLAEHLARQRRLADFFFEYHPLVEHLPLADRLAHERRTAILFDRARHPDPLTWPEATEPGRERTSSPCIIIVLDPREREAPRLIWQRWPAHPPFADEIQRWWPSDEPPSLTPNPPIEDKRPDQLPDVILLPARGGLLDVWI